MYENYLHVHSGISSQFSEKVYERQAQVYERMYSRFFPKDRDAYILDIGCGTGLFLYYLKSRGYENAYGIDASQENIAFVQQYITKNCAAIELEDFLKNENEMYDIIVMNDVLEHISKERIIPSLHVIHEALRPGATFISLVPNMENPLTVYQRWADFTHTFGFTRNSLTMVLKWAGFRKVSVYPCDRKPTTLKGLARKGLELVIRKFVEKMFQYPKGGILFYKRIFAVARKD